MLDPIILQTDRSINSYSCGKIKNINLTNELGQSVQISVQMLPNLIPRSMVNVTQYQPRKVPRYFQGYALDCPNSVFRHGTNVFDYRKINNRLLFAFLGRYSSHCPLFMGYFKTFKHFVFSLKFSATLNQKVTHVHWRWCYTFGSCPSNQPQKLKRT